MQKLILQAGPLQGLLPAAGGARALGGGGSGAGLGASGRGWSKSCSSFVVKPSVQQK